MLKEIIGQIVAHKAGIAMGAAMAGVVVTAVMAAKDRDRHLSNIYEKADDIYNNSTEDDEIDEKDYLSFEDDEMPVIDFYSKYSPKKDRAIIFAKSYWRTGLSMAVTFGLMVLSHVSMVKELAATAAALGVMSTKYKELAKTLKEKYPDTYEKVTKLIDQKNIRKEFSKKSPKKEESYDGRQRYYEEFSKQIFYATDAQIKEAECTVNERLINTGECNLFTYLATFPKSSGIKLYDWMKHIGWYEGDTMYSDVSGYIGSYIKPEIVNEPIIFEGEKINVNKIRWSHCLDFEPDLDDNEVACLEAEMDGIPA